MRIARRARPAAWLSVPATVLLSLPPALHAAEVVEPAAARIQADVARLASDPWQGRRAGTEGADRAADWIAGRFRQAGLAPAGGDRTYFQAFRFIDGVVLGSGNRMSAAGRSFAAGEDFRPLAFSSAGTVRAEVAFAGYGIVANDLDYDDYAGLDVKGKAVLVLRYGPGGDDPQSKWAAFTALRHKAATAREKGASALLVVTGPRTPGAEDRLVPLRADAALADEGIPCFSVKRAVAEALHAPGGTSLEAAQARLDESAKPAPFLVPGLVLEAAADLTPRRSTTRNVVGLLRGSEPKAGIVVVGAHYDHLGLGMTGSLDPSPEGKVHHGADDNASGTAALLALAARLGRGHPRPARSILFVAFGAEEEGALGSSHFVKSPPVPWADVVAMINMDMVGRLRDGALDVHGVGTSPVFSALLAEANRGPQLHLKLRQGGYGPSDHNPFYAAGKPVLFFFTGSHPDYHRPSDTADKINAAGIVRVADVVESVLSALGASSEAVPFTRVAADKEEQAAPARGFRVWVGGIPDYSEEGVGVKFSGVSPGSPAEKAGLQAGDVLLRFGGKEIRNIYDYTYALAEHKPGDVVAAVVRRGGAEVALEITLAARRSETR